MTEIQLNTLLGNFWEQVVSDCLDSIGVNYERSPDLGAGIISPDFVCRKEKTTFFVTCTGSSQSFIKKRWRYINELFQAKSVLGDSTLIANLVLASNKNLQEFEERIFRGLFDIAAFGDEFSDFEQHYGWARSELDSGKSVSDAAEDFKNSHSSEGFRTDLLAWLKAAIKSKPTRLGGLWGQVVRYQSDRTLETIMPNTPTYWRWTCLKLLPFTESERTAVLSAVSGKPIKFDDKKLTAASVECKKSIGGVRVIDSSIKQTLEVFSTPQILETLRVLDDDNREIRFPIGEVVDLRQVKQAYTRCQPGLVSYADFTQYAKSEFKDARSERISIWEYGVALADTSLLDVNKEYVNRWGKIVVANPINNVILKTDIARTIAKKGDIEEIIDRASEIIWKRMPKRITEELFVEGVMDYRRRSLFLQPYLNPTQRRFEIAVASVLGSAPSLIKRDCLLKDIGITGRGSKVESIYVLKRAKTDWIFKVLSGYKGGYEHKADEMASRAWLLRFRLDMDKGVASMASVKLIFVYEGEWDEKYLSLLHASGWDEVVHLSQIESFIKRIPK